MSKHTPGPWRRARFDVIEPNGKTVAVTYAPNDAETVANLNLIAQAPAMLDALHEAAECILRLREAVDLDIDARKHSIETLSIIDGIIHDIQGANA